MITSNQKADAVAYLLRLADNGLLDNLVEGKEGERLLTDKQIQDLAECYVAGKE